MYSVVKLDYPIEETSLWSCDGESIMITGKLMQHKMTIVRREVVWWDTDNGGIRVL